VSDPRYWTLTEGQKEWSRLVEENREQIINGTLPFRLQQVGGYALNAAHREITGLKTRLAELEGRHVWHCMRRDMEMVMGQLDETGEAKDGDVIRFTDTPGGYVRAGESWRRE
jgi:hypothetical protein